MSALVDIAIHEIICNLDRLHDEAAHLDLAALLDLKDALEEVKRRLAGTTDQVDACAYEWFDEKKKVVNGETWERARDHTRRNWQSDELWVRVKDSRLVDPTTGEVVPEVDKVRKVYGCKGYNASLTVLRELGIDPDDFCDLEWGARRVRRARVPK